MIFFLSSVSNKTFEVIRKIFNNEGESEKKGKNKRKSSSKMILGSTFKPFRGLNMDTVHDLLHDVSEGTTSLKEAIKKCQDIKTLQKVQSAFVKATSCGNWDSAVEKYPNFTTADMLEPFKTLDFSDANKIPKMFFSFCRHVMNSVNDNEHVSGETIDQDNHFRIAYCDVFGIMWRTPMEAVDPVTVNNAFTMASVTGFSGFSLSIFDLEGNTQVRYMLCCTK